ncbi:MAG: FeoB-associated Cys-rich membrane protein [Clostridia bacterium]|nr:FeoB-associated Cys-rich membrane protein [Clostridia bacterium]
MENIIVLLVIGLMLAAAVMKILRDRKNGVKCSGCPQSKVCSQVSCDTDSELLKGSDISLLKR